LLARQQYRNLVYFALGPVRTAHGRLFCCSFLFMLLQTFTLIPSTDHPVTVWQPCDPAHFLMRAAAGSHCSHCAHFLEQPFNPAPCTSQQHLA